MEYRQYGLYVPAPGARHDVRPASAIVGEVAGDVIDTHYEGGSGSSNVTTFEHRINQAAGRRVQSYPTVARRSWRPDEVVLVGTVLYDAAMAHWIIGEILVPEVLRDWVGPDEPLVPGGSDQLIEEVGGRAFSRLDPAEQARIMATRLPMTALCAEVLETIRRKSRGTS